MRQLGSSGPRLDPYYDKVIVIVCWWATDNGVASLDARNLHQIFSNVYKFEIIALQLPDQDPTSAFQQPSLRQNAVRIALSFSIIAVIRISEVYTQILSFR